MKGDPDWDGDLDGGNPYEEDEMDEDEDEDAMVVRPVGFQNACVFGASNDKDAWKLGPGICFASLFSTYNAPKENLRWVFSVYRIRKEEYREASDSFLSEILMRFPKHWMDAIEISDVSVDNADIAHGYFKDGVCWKQVRIDGSKLSANAIYVILALLRMPQENPDIVDEIQTIMNEIPGMKWDTAFWIASQLCNHSGHLFVSSADGYTFFKKGPDFYKEGKKKLADFSIAEAIAKIDSITKEPYLQRRAKEYNLAPKFQVTDGVVGWGGFVIPDYFKNKGGSKMYRSSQYIITTLRFGISRRRKSVKPA